MTNYIWVLSGSSPTAHELAATLREQVPLIDPGATIVHTNVCNLAGRRAEPPPQDPSNRLCAAVVVIDPEALGEDEFRYWAQWCIRWVASRPTLRLFMHREEGVSDTDELVVDLEDRVQTSVSGDPGGIIAALTAHLRLARGAREPAWDDLLEKAAIAVGRAAGALQPLCILAGLVILVAGWAGDPNPVLTHAGRPHPGWIAALCGVGAVWLFGVPLDLISNGVPRERHELVQPSHHVVRGVIWLGVCGLLLYAGWRWGGGWTWLPLGVAFGLVIDATRRGASRTARGRLSLARALPPPGVAPVLDPVLRQFMNAAPEHALVRPLLPPVGPLVFVSYSRSSAWGCGAATELYAALSAVGVPTFIDREDLEVGASWRTGLDVALTRADIVVAVLDDHTVARPWVAAEMTLSLEGRRLAGAPEIVLLLQSGLGSLRTAGAQPAFQELGSAVAAGRIGGVHLVDYDANAVAGLAARVRAGDFRSPSLIPGPLGTLIVLGRRVLRPPGWACIGLGWGTGLAILGHRSGLWAFNPAPAGAGFLAGGLVLCALLAGYCCRTALAPPPAGDNLGTAADRSSPGFLGAVIGFVLLSDELSKAVPAVVVGWGLVMGWVGFCVAGANVTRRELPS